MNHTKRIYNRMQETREVVMALTGITTNELNELVYKRGIDCLKYVLRSDEYGITEMPKHPAFWSWWKMQWHRQDLFFMDRVKMNSTMDGFIANLPEMGKHVVLEDAEAVRGAYLILHKTRNNIYLNTALIEQSYHGLMKEIANTK